MGGKRNNKFLVREDEVVAVNGKIVLKNDQVVKAVKYANEALLSLYQNTIDFDINIFEVLGMRNLSGLVGEYYVKALSRISNGSLQSNLHQDGYPDLVLTDTKQRKAYFETLYTEEGGRKHPVSKEVFSPYRYGGVEVKATCGSIPSLGPKLLVGEQRIDYVTAFDWKSHHRQTNNLVGVVWDFIDDVPHIVMVFYSDSLSEDDWGKIVSPSAGGGRTTSVSIMNSRGIKKMCEGWVAILDSQKYIDFTQKKKYAIDLDLAK